MAETNDYVVKLFQTMLNPSESSTPNGQLRSCSNANSQIYVMQGCVTLTTEATTTRVIVMLDPETAFRNGQAKAYCYQYNAAGVIIKFTHILISAPSSNFAYGSVLSSRLDVTNFSSQIAIAGGMTGCVLNSIPKNVIEITQTQMKQKAQPLDYVSAEMSHDGVSLFSVTSHVGTKQRSMLNGFMSRSGWSYDYVSSTSIAQNGWWVGSTELTTANIVNEVWSSAALTESPFTIATFGLEVTVVGVLTQASATTIVGEVTWRVDVYDAKGDSLAQKSQVQVNQNAASKNGELRLNFTFSHLASPIAYVELTCMTAMANTNIATGCTLTLNGLEDIEDIPDRDVMVVACEGINEKASLSIDAVIVVSAAPSTDNTFIAGGSSRENAGNDICVHNMLTHVHKQLPRAHKRSEAAVFGEAMRLIQSSKLHCDTMHAWSMPNFQKMGRAIHSTAQHVRHGVRQAHQLMEQASPYLQQVQDLAEQHKGVGGKLGHFIGKVGDVAGAANKYSTQAREYTQHADSGQYADSAEYGDVHNY